MITSDEGASNGFAASDEREVAELHGLHYSTNQNDLAVYMDWLHLIVQKRDIQDNTKKLVYLIIGSP